MSPTEHTAKVAKAEQKLLLEWAWSQVEAMADGSLDRQQSRRMRQAMHIDAELNQAVQAARALLRQLWGQPRSRSSWALLRRLWVLPQMHRPPERKFSWPAWGLTAACVVAFFALFIRLELQGVSVDTPPPSLVLSPTDAIQQLHAAQQLQALREFNLAMSYVRKSAQISRRATNRSLGGSLQHALSVGWQSWINDDLHFENGD